MVRAEELAPPTKVRALNIANGAPDVPATAGLAINGFNNVV
jgi:hypothetical protein